MTVDCLTCQFALEVKKICGMGMCCLADEEVGHEEGVDEEGGHEEGGDEEDDDEAQGRVSGRCQIAVA